MDQAFADAAALGVTVTAAAGDDGSNDRDGDGQVHVDFPASSPHVLACGGTSLHADPTTGTVTSETVWNHGATGGATGGGVSDVFPLPSWQAKRRRAHVGTAAASGRGVPDVAGRRRPADRLPGARRRQRPGHRRHQRGRTAVGRPDLPAGPVARRSSACSGCALAEAVRRAAAPGSATSPRGNNGAYKARKGWDACTGLGVPVGDALLTALRASQSPPP